MSEIGLYSCKIRMLIFIGEDKARTANDQVRLIEACDFTEAFQKALQIGRSEEETYKNGEGEDVSWKFSEVISLDNVWSKQLDGAEVYSEPVHLSESDAWPPDRELTPELSNPIQTV